MYNVIFSQNGHFKFFFKPTKITIYLSCPMILIKANILLINVNTLIKLDLLKSCDFLYEYRLFHDWKWVTPLDKYMKNTSNFSWNKWNMVKPWQKMIFLNCKMSKIVKVKQKCHAKNDALSVQLWALENQSIYIFPIRWGSKCGYPFHI